MNRNTNVGFRCASDLLQCSTAGEADSRVRMARCASFEWTACLCFGDPKPVLPGCTAAVQPQNETPGRGK